MNQHQLASIRSFNRKYTAMLGVFNKQVFNTALTWPEGRILLEISFTASITPILLSEKLNLDKSYTSRLIKKLATTGYLVKNRSKEDLRSINLSLTDKGKKMVVNLNKQTDHNINNAFINLSDSEQADLYHAIEIINNLLFKQ